MVKKEPPKLSIKTPGFRQTEKEEAERKFIGEAPGGSLEPKPQSPIEPIEPASNEILPWQEPGVREDVIKQFNLRLPESDLLKLRYVVEKHRARSINSYILEILLPRLNDDIAELTGTKP